MPANSAPVVSNIRTASGKPYEVLPGGMRPGAIQFTDRRYHFGEMPACLVGQTYVKTAGNDKMYEEHEFCLSFDVDRDVTVYVLHGRTFPALPGWLESFHDTGQLVTRPIEDDPRGMVFRVFRRDYPKGTVVLNGDLPKGFLTPPFRDNSGSGFCMYSVVVAGRQDVNSTPPPLKAAL